MIRSQTAAAWGTDWWAEIRALAALAFPLVLGNLSWSAMAATDLLWLGRLGPDAVAAGALALSVYNVLFVLGIGLAAAASPLIASERGRRRHSVRDIRRTVRAMLQTLALVCVPAWVLLWAVAPVLRLLGQDPALAAGAARLMHGLQWALLPWLGFIVLRNFIVALERPLWGVVVLALGIPFNFAAGWVLIFGHLGLPALGLAGAGLASSLTAVAMMLGMVAVLAGDRRFRRYRLLGRWWVVDRPRLRDVARVGVPIAVTQVLEVAVFNAAVILMGLFGRTALAAHAIAIQIAALSFMVPLGLSQAATVRVGHAEGRGDRAAIGRAGWAALAVGSLYALAAGIVLVAAPHRLLGLFLDVATPANAPVVALGTTFLAVAALFQLFDCAQVIAVGALRGLQDTRVPMLIAGIGYWVIGVGAGILLAFPLHLRGVGIWLGLATGLAAVAGLLVVRWSRRDRLIARISPPAPPGSPRRIATPA